MRCMACREDNRRRKLLETAKWLKKMQRRYAKQIKVIQQTRKLKSAELTDIICKHRAISSCVSSAFRIIRVRFVGEGAYVFITGRRQKELDAAVKEIGKNVTFTTSASEKW